ncbi:GNAT family N-acetyltransferase [Pelagibius sp. Alg239-R121]|uniref:GNAT family N-acetyltransferase n=1 Tax=Pelagibius sp. Alg239-R121 TaxID=2993448 RepID=UPI0024A6B4B5|nr:GNAT family N-acetyltransferase [Pelagibius sp. Alg239-R121]
MAISIRPAQQSDLSELLRLYQQLNPADPLPDRETADGVLLQMLENPMTRILIALEDGHAVSTCTLVIVPNLTRNLASYAVIENVVTDTACRGRGAGKAVMNYAIEQAWEAGCYKVMLMTGKQRDNTVAFYGSLGFSAERKTGMEIRRP